MTTPSQIFSDGIRLDNILRALQNATITVHGPRIVPLVEAQGMSAAALWVPPSSVAKAHMHENSDILIVPVMGFAKTVHGDAMDHTTTHGPFDVAMIPAGVPHAAVNLSRTDPIIALEIRRCVPFDADLQLLPHLQPVMDDWQRRAATPEFDGELNELRSRWGGNDLKTVEDWTEAMVGVSLR